MAKVFRAGETVDFVVGGAGAAGGIMARELATSGCSLIVLEQAQRTAPADFEHDELKYVHLNGIANDPAAIPQSFRQLPSEVANPVVGQNARVYPRILGRNRNPFIANFWRCHEIDFNEQCALGGIAGTGFAHWPISYSSSRPATRRCDGSSFVASGRRPPTRAIGTPAFRAAHHIGQFARRNQI